METSYTYAEVTDRLEREMTKYIGIANDELRDDGYRRLCRTIAHSMNLAWYAKRSTTRAARLQNGTRTTNDWRGW